MTRPDNWRTRLADWLTGGALTRQDANARQAWAQLRAATLQSFDRGEALREIAAMETPSANATVKRMAARAKKALGDA